MAQAAAAGTRPDRAGQITSILTPLTALSQETKALAWDVAMDDALDETAVTTRLQALPLPNAARAALWDLRFAAGAETAPAAPGATIPPSPDAPAIPGATRFSRVATPIMGAIAGGTKGAAVGLAAGGPPGAFVGGLAGAGLGAGAGELLQTGFEKVFPPTADADQEARAGLTERLGREVSAGVTGEAGGHLFGPVLRALGRLPGIRRFLAPAESQLEPFAREALEEFTVRGPSGNVTHVLPGEVSRSRIIDLAQNVAQASALGGKRVADIPRLRQATTTRRVQGILDDLGPAHTTELTGRAIRGRMDALTAQFRRQSQVLWDDWRTLGGEVTTPTTQTDVVVADLLNIPAGAIKSNTGLRAAQRWAARGGEAPLDGVAEGIASATRGFTPEQLTSMAADSPALRRTLDEMSTARAAADLADIPTANAVQELISELGQIQDTAQRTLRGASPTTAARQTGRIATIMRNALLEDINQALGQSSPEAQQAYTAARAFTASRSAILRARPVEKLMQVLNEAPEQVIQTLVTKNNSTQINAVRQAIGDDAFRLIETRALREFVDANPRTGEIHWGDFLQKTTTPGMADTMTALFPNGQAQQITRFARLMQQLNINQIGGIGKLAVQFAQASAVIGVITGRIEPETGAIFLTPMVLARVMASPSGLRWLTTGLRAPAGSPIAARAAGNLLSFMLTPEPDAEGETPGIAPGTTLRLDPRRLGEVTGVPGVPGVRTGARVSLGQ